jgi:hypothetical protein
MRRIRLLAALSIETRQGEKNYRPNEHATVSSCDQLPHSLVFASIIGRLLEPPQSSPSRPFLPFLFLLVSFPHLPTTLGRAPELLDDRGEGGEKGEIEVSKFSRARPRGSRKKKKTVGRFFSNWHFGLD